MISVVATEELLLFTNAINVQYEFTNINLH